MGRKILYLSNPLLVGLLSLDGARTVQITGMPADAKIVNVSDQVRFDQDVTAFIIESDTFPDVAMGEPFPELRLTVTEVKPKRGPEFL